MLLFIPDLKKDNNSLTYFHAILDKAIHSLSEAIEERKRRSLKNNKKLYFKRAYCLQGQAETEENEANKEVLYRKSMDDYNLSLELEPKDTDSLWNKSLIHEYFNELNDAVECLARALVNKNEEKFMKKLVKFINKQPDLILCGKSCLYRANRQRFTPTGIGRALRSLSGQVGGLRSRRCGSCQGDALSSEAGFGRGVRFKLTCCECEGGAPEWPLSILV